MERLYLQYYTCNRFVMNHELFIQTVTKMRDFQKQYFEAQRRKMYATAGQILPQAKAYEAKVDRMLADMANATSPNQIDLFK